MYETHARAAAREHKRAYRARRSTADDSDIQTSAKPGHALHRRLLHLKNAQVQH
jgi:hypothetical protein